MGRMLLKFGIAHSIILVAVLFCMHGVGAASGPTDVLPAGRLDNSPSGTQSEILLPSCSIQNVSLRVEASDKARKDLSGWLAKDTTRLVFIYFDLVLENLTYHPGSCPNGGKTAIDAQTPLAWVLTNDGPDGGGDIGSHSFAHAYLTLPVSYPRIYSMGILDGHYVASMRHEVYGMKLVVGNTTTVDGKSCWNELNKTEKASLVLEVVQGLVRDLDRSDNTTSWSMCYTDPTNEGLPFSNSPLIPYTPVYVCQDGSGSMRKLERDSFLKGLFVLFIILSFGALALQLFAFSMGLRFLRVWGERMKSPSFRGTDELFCDDDFGRFFDKVQLPVHVKVGGLLSADLILGRRAFIRLKWVVFLGTVFFLYAAWPNLLVQSILIPRSSIASLGRVSSSETFGRNLPCQPNIPVARSLSLVSTDFYCFAGPFFCALYSLLLLIRDPNDASSRLFLSFSAAPLQRLSSIFVTALTYLRVILLFPTTRPTHAADFRKATCCALFWAFVLAQILFWIPLLSILGILVTLCLIKELFEITGCRTIYRTFFDLAVQDGCEYFAMLIVWLFVVSPVVVLYIQGSELLMFVLLSSISLYITYPLPTFLVVSWSLALIAEAQNMIQDYRSPLLSVQEVFADKCFGLAKMHFDLASSGFSDNRPCLKKESASGQKVDWEKFLRHSEEAWDKVCLQLLTFRDWRFGVRTYPGQTDSEECVASILNMLDIRSNSERNQNETVTQLQKMLWMRFFKGTVKLVFLVVLFLSIIMLLLAFNSLWKDPSPKDTNSLLLTILVVPMYTFLRTKLSSSSLTDVEKHLIEKSLDKELNECFQNSIINVSENHLKTVCMSSAQICINTKNYWK